MKCEVCNVRNVLSVGLSVRWKGWLKKKEELHMTSYNSQCVKIIILFIETKLTGGRTQWVIFNMFNLRWHLSCRGTEEAAGNRGLRKKC